MFLPILSMVAVLPLVPLTPEDRAIAFLSREVAFWPPAKKCYSCHNNGDGARALYHATRLGLRVPDRALADTSHWLAQPRQWENIRAEEGASGDKGLALIQFAAALVEALEAGRLKDRTVLAQAAELVAVNQHKDGYWKVDAESLVGSPVTYGPYLATRMARATLQKADPERYRDALSRADNWFRKASVKTVLDAAAVLLALVGTTDRGAADQRQRCLELIRNGESRSGGWGPYVSSPPETFDTAVVVLALTPLADQDDIVKMIRRGRDFLLAAQLPDGSWKETTRPGGSDSYAQRLSTTGWATLALLATRSK